MFDLKKLEDFSGNYAAAGAGATVGGGEAMIMRNQNGVVIELTSTTPGRQPEGGDLGTPAQRRAVVATGMAAATDCSQTGIADSAKRLGREAELAVRPPATAEDLHTERLSLVLQRARSKPMKTLGTLVVALALALSAQTAEAHIVQFVTVVPMTAVDGGQDEAAVSNIILTAVKDALRQAVAFEPTLVVVEDARVVGGHLYLRVLAADSEGEALIQELENARAPVGRVTSRDASPGGVLVGADEAAPQRHGIRPGSSNTSPARSIRTRNGDPGVR